MAKGADCKSVVSDFDGSNPSSSTKKKIIPFRDDLLFGTSGFEGAVSEGW